MHLPHFPRLHLVSNLETSGLVGLPGAPRPVCLKERGTTWARVIAGSDTVPPILLLHGWSATADINWATSYHWLHGYSVVAIDHRGHGRGIRSKEPFSIDACADDAASLVETLGLGPVVAVGYSMGGPIALSMARRHPDKVVGLVAAATACRFGKGWIERIALHSIGTVGHLGRTVLHALQAHFPDLIGDIPASLIDEAAEIAEAAEDIACFDARPWAASLRLPAAVVRTTKDSLVPPAHQTELAELLGAQIFDVHADHGTALMPGRLGPTLRSAVESVVSAPATAQAA
jgi:3-oxoadipate enol-lactonase